MKVKTLINDNASVLDLCVTNYLGIPWVCANPTFDPHFRPDEERFPRFGFVADAAAPAAASHAPVVQPDAGQVRPTPLHISFG